MTSRDTKEIINGQAWHRYAVDYLLDGRLFSLDIMAMDDEHPGKSGRLSKQPDNYGIGVWG